MPMNSTAYEENKIALANVTIRIAGARITTALHGITIRDVKAWIEKVEEDQKQKAVHARICLYIDSVRSKREAAHCIRAFERCLLGRAEDSQR